MKTPSASNNQFGITCSFPGLCSYCHTEVANFNGSFEVRVPKEAGSNELVSTGVFRPKISSFKPNIRTSEFKLNDGTLMTVVLCEECDDDIEPKHMKQLMESEIKGWQKEVDEICPQLKPEMKLDYMAEHSEKFVTDRISRRWSDKQLKVLSKPDIKTLNIKVREK